MMNTKSKLHFFYSKNGVLNIEVNGLCYYSKYNPDKDVEKFLLSQLVNDKKRYILFGLGLGYHAQKLLELDTKEIIVFENNLSLINEVKKKIDLKNLFNHPRLKLITDWQRLTLSDDEDQIIILPTWYKTLEDKHFKEVFQSIIINRNTLKSRDLLNDNFTMNIKNYLYNMMPLKNILQGKKAILVAAGPSLDDEIDFLKRAKGKYFILAVGAAYKTLQSNAIEPDALIIIDPNPSVYDQIENTELKIPLFFASTVYPKVVLHDTPLKVMLFQKGVQLAEDFAKKNDINLLETGGSVANMGFSLLLFMGCKSLIFVGQDLAYIDGKNHSNQSSSNVEFKNNISSIFKTISNEGKEVETSGSWNYYRSFFEKEIPKYDDVEFINTSLKGASIKGARYMNSKKILFEVDEVTEYLNLLIKQFKL